MLSQDNKTKKKKNSTYGADTFERNFKCLAYFRKIAIKDGCSSELNYKRKRCFIELHYKGKKKKHVPF